MEELKKRLSEVLNIDDEKAQAGVETVVAFLKEKLPENMHGLLDNLDGDAASGALDSVKGLFGK